MTRKPRYLLLNLWCNTLTNPLLNVLLFCIRQTGAPAPFSAFALGILEIAVVFAEFAVYRLADAKKQNNKWYFRLSLVTNAVSFSIGEILALMSG